jgi:hypothetical protein
MRLPGLPDKPGDAPAVIRCVITWSGDEDTDISDPLRGTREQPTGPPSLVGAELRHARAKEKIGHFAGELAAYIDQFDLSPEKTQLKAGQPHAMHPIDLRKIKSPDVALGVPLGEIVYNLRATLDYLVYEVAWLDSREPQEGTQFPIETNPDVFEGRVTGFYIEAKPGKKPKKRTCKRYLAGVNKTHVGWIKTLQPCNGCNWTQTLQDLSNPDKHRQILSLSNAFRAGLTPLGPARDTDTGRVVDVELKYTPFISVNGIDLMSALRIIEEEVGNVLALFRPEFERAIS